MASAIRISEAVSIGVHAALCMSSDPTRRWTAQEIVERYGFSKAHLAKIMSAMAHAGLVFAMRGPGGGARLRIAPEKITLLAIYEAIDGPMTMSECLLGERGCGISCCQIGPKLAAYNREIRDLFASTTLDGLAKQFTCESTSKSA